MSERKSIQIHQFARLFPALDDDDLTQLADDIRQNGLQNPIWLDEEGMILDGRNRSAACAIAGVEPHYKTFQGNDEDKLRFVCSQNVHRRHLTTSQRAMIAASLVESFEVLAETRMMSGGHPQANLPEGQKGQSRDLAGAAMNVSGRSVESAKQVKERAAPEVIDKVMRGDLAVSKAAKIAELPKDQQLAELESAPTSRAKQLDIPTLYYCLVDGDPLNLADIAVAIADPTIPLTGDIVFFSEDAAIDEGAKHYDRDDCEAVPVLEFLKRVAKESAGL